MSTAAPVSTVAGTAHRSYLLAEALAERAGLEELVVLAEPAASVVSAGLAASVELVVSVELAELGARAGSEAQVASGSTTRSIEAVRHIRIGPPRTALAARLGEIRWLIVRREQGNRLASKVETWRATAAEVLGLAIVPEARVPGRATAPEAPVEELPIAPEVRGLELLIAAEEPEPVRAIAAEPARAIAPPAVARIA
jgi:hypothetical protein